MTIAAAGSGTRIIRSSGYRPPARFESLVNFRDLGGHSTGAARVTRRGVFFRADGVHRCTPSDVSMLESLGVRRVIDLRTAQERVDDGSFAPRHATIEYRHIPVLDDVSGIGEITHDEPLVVSYLHMLDARGPRIVEVVNALVGAPGPAVFHCTAGKDRTGVVAAVLLRAVGVPGDRVVADYAKSAAAMERLIAWYRTNRSTLAAPVQDPDGDASRTPLMGAEPAWMERALEHLERRHGGAERYLLSQGATSAAVRDLRARLLG